MRNENQHEPRSPVKNEKIPIEIVDIGEENDLKLESNNARFALISLGVYISSVIIIVAVIFGIRVYNFQSKTDRMNNLVECTTLTNDSERLSCERAKRDLDEDIDETDLKLKEIMLSSITAISIIYVIGLALAHKKKEGANFPRIDIE